MNKIIIIGGGASGLIASIYASKNGNEVTLLEKNNNCGKKILITGNGKCNYFNEDFTIKHYRSNNMEILNTIINDNNKKLILDFFNSIGIVPKIKNGYYYPNSNQAITIREALIIEAKLKGVNIINDVTVNNVTYINNKFNIETNKGTYYSDKVVIATGSKASPNTGSDGIGYKFTSNFGHTVIKPLPALVQLKGIDNYYKDWAGIKMDAAVNLYENNKYIDTSKGEILLTEYGVSGICIFDLSGRVARGLDSKKKEHLEINFLPWLDGNIDDSIKWFDKQSILVYNRTISQILDGMLNYKLVNLILKQEKIANNTKWNDLNKDKKISLINKLTKFYIEIKDVNSFDKAQICSGGIPLSEININNMESLKQKGLYIVGELLDVDGDCGGYNLGFAWLSGILAGKAL